MFVLKTKLFIQKYITTITRTSNKNNGYFIQDSINHKVKDENIIDTINTNRNVDFVNSDFAQQIQGVQLGNFQRFYFCQISL